MKNIGPNVNRRIINYHEPSQGYADQSLDALQPAAKGADVTGNNTANDVKVGAGKAVAEAGAQAFDGKSITKLVDRVAANVEYGAAGSGVTLESLKPAEAGSNVTETRVSANANSIEGHDTIEVVDGAQLGNQASWGQVAQKPTTISELGMTGVIQPALPDAQAPDQVLMRQPGGDAYWANRYAAAYITGRASIVVADTVLPTSRANIGNQIRIPNPGVPVQVLAGFVASCYQSGNASVWINISLDGGATWGTESVGYGVMGANGGDVNFSAACANGGMPAGDILINLAGQTSVNAKLRGPDYSHLWFVVQPLPSNWPQWAIVGAPLAVTIPASVSGNCSKDIVNGTTCTASANVTAQPSGGSGGYTYSWAKVSGTDTITSGATAQTCTVSGTHTTASPAATSQTVVNCTVSSGGVNATSNNCTVTLSFLRTQSALQVSVANASCSCRTYVSSDTCTASGTLTGSTSGGDGTYSHSWVRTSGVGTITSGATSATVHVSGGARSNQTVTGTFQDTVQSGGDQASDSGTMTFSYIYIQGGGGGGGQ